MYAYFGALSALPGPERAAVFLCGVTGRRGRGVRGEPMRHRSGDARCDMPEGRGGAGLRLCQCDVEAGGASRGDRPCVQSEAGLTDSQARPFYGRWRRGRHPPD